MIIKNIKTAFFKAALILCVLYSGQLSANTWLNLDEDESYTARHEASFVQAGNRFYLFGGRENPRTLDTYDYVQDEWTTATSAPIEFNHFQAIEYQGLIWVIGAFRDNGFPNESPAEHIYIYDPANDVWNQGPEIPVDRRRGSAGLVEYEGKFYVVGGNTIGHNGGYVSWFDVYDPQTGSWTALHDAPNARDHFHATVANNKLYAAGGRLSGGAGGTFAPTIAQVDVYDFATGSWSSLPSSGDLPTPRAGTSTVTFQGNVVVIGGEGDGQAYKTVEQLDPNTNLWTEIASMNHARHGTQAIVSGNGIFTALGSPRQGGGRQHNMEAFNSSTPSGVASSAAAVAFDLNEVVLTSTDVVDVSLNHTNGNQGALLTSISLVGNNASSFTFTNQNVLPNLLAVGASKTISIRARANVDGDFSSLRVTYDDGAIVSIPIRAQFQNSEPQPTTTNLSLGKIAEQSSTSHNGVASRAVDGDTNGTYRDQSVTHTSNSNQPWWQVDLGENALVDSVELFNRTDSCCTLRLSNFYIMVSSEPFANRSLSELLSDTSIARSFHTSLSTSSIDVDFNDAPGRYVRVQLRDANVVLSLAEVQVVGRISDDDEEPAISNLSLGQPSQQSSTSHSGVASRAVDGNTNGVYNARSVTHTSPSSNQAWWQVDLGDQALVDNIVLFNRIDACCTSRLSNFYVMVSPQPFGSRSLGELLNDQSIQRSFHSSLSSNSIEIDFNNAQGQYVRIQLQNSGVLSLAEVEVMGHFSDGEPAVISNLSISKAVAQHSTGFGGSASRAVDGNPNGQYFGGSVTHTNTAFQTWWQVDLAVQSSIESVIIHNRTDCCSDRLANFYVLISTEPFGNRSLSELLSDSSIQSRFESNLNASSIEIDFNNAQGRYVRVQLINTNPLSLAEVEVMGSVQ